MLIACVAPGWSLPSQDLRGLARCDAVIAVTRAYAALPTGMVDHVYACDLRWWQRYYDEAHSTGAELWGGDPGVTALDGPRPVKYVCVDPRPRQGLHTETPNRVNGGGGSGFQALNLAFHLGATHAVLVGYDMRPEPETKRTHFFGEYEGRLRPHVVPYGYWLAEFNALPDVVNGMRITCCTPGSPLKFNQRAIEEVVCGMV